MKKLFVKKGDKVMVIAGKEKGKTGKILRAYPRTNRVVIESLNLTKKATRASQNNPQGGLITLEGSVNASNVAILCSSCDKPVRVGYIRGSEGQRIRICRSCENRLDKE